MFEQRPGVDILWPDGETEAIKGFVTEHDAVKWIAEHSKGWGTRTSSPTVYHNRPGQRSRDEAGAKRARLI